MHTTCVHYAHTYVHIQVGHETFSTFSPANISIGRLHYKHTWNMILGRVMIHYSMYSIITDTMD